MLWYGGLKFFVLHTSDFFYTQVYQQIKNAAVSACAPQERQLFCCTDFTIRYAVELIGTLTADTTTAFVECWAQAVGYAHVPQYIRGLITQCITVVGGVVKILIVSLTIGREVLLRNNNTCLLKTLSIQEVDKAGCWTQVNGLCSEAALGTTERRGCGVSAQFFVAEHEVMYLRQVSWVRGDA